MPDPTGVLADGNLKVLYVPAIAVVTAPTVAELTAGTVIDVSCYLTTFTPGTDEATVTDERVCSRQVFEDVGRFTDKIDWAYVYQAQLPLAADNRVFATFKRGVAGFLALRWGMDFAVAIAAAQIVDTYPIRCGQQMKQAPEGNTKLKVNQSLKVTGTVARDVAVVA